MRLDKKRKRPGPAVNCSHAEMVAAGKLKPSERNPNQHPKEQLRLYAKILNHQGWRKPIVVSRRSGCIVTGHGAWLAALQEGWDLVPVDYQDFKSEADEVAHMLADNRLPQLAELDEAEFSALVNDTAELDPELAGILEEEAESATELKPVEVKPPPKMAWVLIGIPLVRFSEINAQIEIIAAVPETTVASTVNDTPGKL